MRRVALFARPPEAGRVKTRLAPALTPALTLELYRAMLMDALEAGTGVAAERLVWWASAPERGLDPGLQAILERGTWRERLQVGGDLGARLAHAFADPPAAPGDRTVIMGADCPELDGAALEAALGELERSDAVLGPTTDGGYYLVGLRRPAPELFRDIAWGEGDVLNQTLERAERAGFSVTLLGKLDDVDRPEDLVGCVARELGREVRGPRGAGASAARDTETTVGRARAGPLASPRLGAHTRSALRGFGLLP